MLDAVYTFMARNTNQYNIKTSICLPKTIFSQIKTLDSNGACDYRFLPMVLGTYFVTVEKVASPAGASSSTLNVCFDGTTPVSRTVTLTKRSRTVSAQDFTINFYIAWDYPHLCW